MEVGDAHSAVHASGESDVHQSGPRDHRLGALPPLAIVGHVGRKSGRRYRTPVVAFPTATGFVIPMTYGRDVDWARNLVNQRGGELERRGRRIALRNPRIVGTAAAYPHLPVGVRSVLRMADFPGYVLVDAAAAGSPSSTPRTARRRRS